MDIARFRLPFLHAPQKLALLLFVLWTIPGFGQQQIKLTASDGAANDFFGDAIALAGDQLLVGAPNDDDNGDESGSVYVYQLNGGVWQQVDKLTASDGQTDDRFGDAIAVDGNRALIGASVGNGAVADSGAVYVFEFDGLQWQETAKLTASDGGLNDRFGIAVSLAGDQALIGADGDDDLGGQAGAAYRFAFDGMNWNQQQKLLASDGDSIANFGVAVSLQPGRALIGAPGDDQIAIVSGAAYVFEPGATPDWVETQKLIAADGAFGDGLGLAVSLDGNTALVGSSGNGPDGAAYVFDFDGLQWQAGPKLTPTAGSGGELFGESLVLRGNQALIGAPMANGVLADTGAMYRFQRTGMNWNQVQKLTASDGDVLDGFGVAIDFRGDRFAAGADENLSRGAAYLYENVANLTLDVVAPAQATAGADLTVDWLVTNRGPDPASAVQFTVGVMPALATTTISAPCAGGFPCDLGTLPSGQAIPISVTYAVPPDATGVIDVDGQLSSTTSDDMPGDESAMAAITIVTEADLAVTKSGPAFALPGSTIDYMLQIDHLGGSLARNAVLSDTFSSELSLLSVNAPCAGGFPCDLGDLKPGQSLMLTAQFQVMAGFTGTVSNTAAISSDASDPVAANNSSTATTTVDDSADLSIVKSGPAQATAGGVVSYTLTVNNLSANPAADVVVDDPTPAGLTVAAISAPCAAGFPCNLGAINGGGSIVITVDFQVPANASGSIDNTATVSSSVTDPQPANNSSTVNTPIVQSADLAVSLSAVAPVVAGGDVEVTLRVDNLGLSDAVDITLTTPLLNGLTFISAQAPCTGGFPCLLGGLTAGSNIEIIAFYSVPSSQQGTVQLDATVSSATSDPDSGNNMSTLNPDVTRISDLSISKRSNSIFVDQNGMLTYQIGIANSGPSDAPMTMVQDFPPVSIFNISWTCTPTGGASCAASGSDFIDLLVDLPAGSAAEFILTGEIGAEPENQFITNTATITQAVGITDPAPANNSASDSDIVALFADGFEQDE
ncbi:MAG: hypothetical protein Tsb002_20760 [Wenzhouxiangellaceae bacterium]